MEDNSDLVPVVVDLGVRRKNELNEGLIDMFAGQVKLLMRRLLGDVPSGLPVSVRGTPSEIKSFANAMNGEKSYMQSFRRYGLGDDRTYQSKYNLDKAVKNFEKETGLKWPFK